MRVRLTFSSVVPTALSAVVTFNPVVFFGLCGFAALQSGYGVQVSESKAFYLLYVGCRTAAVLARLPAKLARLLSNRTAFVSCPAGAGIFLGACLSRLQRNRR